MRDEGLHSALVHPGKLKRRHHMKKTIYYVKNMDCSAEEQMIRMHLEELEYVHALTFDLGARRLDVFHFGEEGELDKALERTGMVAHRTGHEEHVDSPQIDESTNRRPLMWALLINAALFVCELIAGTLSGSMGLVADSLDMLADALVYALSLMAIGSSVIKKRRLAASSGYLQLGLAVFGLVEVIRRAWGADSAPDSLLMILVSMVALCANIVTLCILKSTQRGEAHIEASWIFTSNDIKVNVLVIAAGGMVWWSGSSLPDLIVGGLIFVIVARGARQILRLAHQK